MHHEILAPVQHSGGGSNTLCYFNDKNRGENLRGMDLAPSSVNLSLL